MRGAGAIGGVLLPLVLAAQPPTGYLEGRLGGRVGDDPGQDAASIRELRMQVGKTGFAGPVDYQVKADFLYDDLDADRSDVDLDTGEGWVDLRSAWAAVRPTRWMDVKAGRQVLTWGTGDLLFLNDMFPKDWQSFFNGRDVEYLKAPSDAAWVAMYPGAWTVDVVVTPRFDPDRYLDGDGISFYPQGRYTPASPMPAEVPDGPEVAVRLARNFGSLEAALYAYDGYWKSPGGFNDEGEAVFPELRVWGASALWPAAGGLVNVEGAYYDSHEDRDGDDPGVRNSETRLLAGYTRELAADVTLGVQGVVEWMGHHDAYARTLPDGRLEQDEIRQVTTLRLTRLLWNQKLMLSGFLFASPTDEDGYLRLLAEYKWSDDWAVSAGGNGFAGFEPHTFFGRFEDNTNLFVAIRRWF